MGCQLSFKMDGKLDYYKILQLDPSAEPEIIEVVYRRLARKYHPDVNHSPDANQYMQNINLAYEVLRDPAKRAEYDRLRQRAKAEHSHSTRRQKSRKTYRYDEKDSIPRPTLVAWPPSLEFGLLEKGAIRSARLRVGVTQGRTINCEVLPNHNWIKIGPLHFTGNSSAIVQITVDAADLRDGARHEGTVTISSLAYGKLVVPVSVKVAPEPRPALLVEPEVLDFGVMHPGQPPKVLNLSLANQGREPLEGFLNPRAPWLEVSQVEFKEPLCVEVIADASGLKPNRTYTSRLEISSNVGIAYILARVRVLEPFPQPGSEEYWSALIARLEPCNKWEKNFLETLALQARQRGWQPSPNQEAILERMQKRQFGP